MEFYNRLDAAMRLIPLLEKYKKEDGIILAIPRGGVPIAYIIAKELNFPMDLIFTKKIGHPMNKEYAIGSVSMEDEIINPETRISEDYIKSEIIRIRKELQQRYHKFMGNREPLSVTGKTVIIVDDGIATGNTILVTIHLIKKHDPKKIILAIPVAPPDIIQKLKKEVGEVICLYTPIFFRGIGQFYEDFEQVSDEVVMELLENMKRI